MSTPPHAPAPDTSAPFFEQMYRKAADPWNFQGSPYEQERYRQTLAALPSQSRFRHALEPGCSIGVLTEKLAPFCDHVEAIDLAPTAIQAAQQRCAHLPNIAFAVLSLDDWLAHNSTAGIDLLLLSEIGYYASPEHWQQQVRALVDPLPSRATVLAVHWLGHSPDHRQTGDSVHEILAAHPGLRHDHSARHPATTPTGAPSGFRLDRWSRQ